MLTIKNIYRPTILQNNLHSNCPCALLVINLFILRLVRTTNGLDGDAGLQLPTARYDEFQSKFIYNEERVSREKTSSPFEKVSKGTVDFFLDDTDELPPGYIVKEDPDNSIDIGPNIRNNDWKDFLKTYKLVLTITFLVLLLILLVPILGIIYCCFCLKCRGPCYRSARGPQRIICGLCLLFLLIGIIFGIVIALISNNLMDDGFKQMSKTKGLTETIHNEFCMMLEETSQRIKYLYVDNYAQMQNHIAKYRIGSSVESYENFSSSNTQSIKKLRKLTQNIPNIPLQLFDLSEMVKRARFIADQLRDALRAIKRDITNTLFKMCTDSASTCKHFILIQSIPTLDRGCLHYDLLPNITDTIEAFEKIKDTNYSDQVNEADRKLTKFKSVIKDAEKDMVPIILEGLQKGAQMLNNQTETTNQKVYSLMNNIKRQNAKPRAKHFTRLDAIMGSGRYALNIIFCTILIVIIICLIIGLILTCLNVGSLWMLVPIIIIFITFSLLALVGLYYFIMGLVLHRGVCMNSAEKLLSVSTLDVGSLDHTTINGCESNTSLYNVMNLDTAFDLDALRDYVMGNITNNAEKANKRIMPDLELNEFTLLAEDQVNEMLNILKSPNITQFNIINFTKIMCKELVPVSLPTLAINLEGLADKLDRVKEDEAIVALRNDAIHLRAFQKFLYLPLMAIVNQIHNKLEQIKSIMTDGENEDFGKSIDKNVENIKNLETSIRRNGQVVIQDMSSNMSEFVRRELDNYIRMVQATVDTNQIGPCKMLKSSRSQSNSFQFCKEIVQPMNNFWFGLLLSTLLLLPALYVAHKLRCLIYKKDIVEEDYEDRTEQPQTQNPDLYAPIPPSVHVAAMPNPYSGGYPYDCHCPVGLNEHNFGKFQYKLYGDPEPLKLYKRKTD